MNPRSQPAAVAQSEAPTAFQSQFCDDSHRPGRYAQLDHKNACLVTGIFANV